MKLLRLVFITVIISLSSDLNAQIAMADNQVKPLNSNSNDLNKKSLDRTAPPKIVMEEETVFVDETSKTYVNKNLPIYLKFSITPDGKTYDLKSQKHPEDATPIYLDTEGPNLIRTKWAVDPSSKEYVYPLREVEMELYADSKPPIVSPILSSTNKYRLSNVTYYGGDLEIQLKDWDEQSGVKGSLWSLNNANWETGKATFSNQVSGDYSFSYYAVDNVNNYSETATINFVYDNQAPITKLIKTHLENFVFGPNTSLQFDVIEEHSGIRATYFKLGDISYIKAKEGQVLPASLADGDYVISYYSVDNVNNGEELKEMKVYLDKTAPVTSINATSSFTDDDILFVSAASLITLFSEDNKAGVEQINYSTRSTTDRAYENAFSFQDFHGLTSVKYNAIDKVANLEQMKTQKVFVDTLRPSTDIEFVGDYFEVANRYYVNENTKLKLVGSDENAGLAYIEFAGIGDDFSEYDQPFTLKNEGYYGMMYRSIDNVNNVEYSKSIDLYLDKKGPEIVYNFSNRPIGVEDGVPVYPSGTRLFLGATDDQSGTNSISYQVNDQKEVHYSSPKTIDISEKKAFKKGQAYNVKITTSDLVSNDSVEVIAFKIED
ncbi:OmpL47-type beta-barrel domain-containing protein [Ekhidna sp.]|uniref:OmpL47-type beta-barrel domain-containing protein n=1 Tax=Ekhidna sp. TaxID=2608089 RepID=UPI003BABAA86